MTNTVGPRHPFLQVLLALGFLEPHEGELIIAFAALGDQGWLAVNRATVVDHCSPLWY